MIFDVLIPAYNESGSIHRIETELIPQLRKDGIEFDILIVDDGSVDKTGTMADDLALRRGDVRVIHHESNKGLGAALRTGYKNAKHPWIVSIDCDLSYSPDQIRNLVLRTDSNADLVIGSPYMRGGRVTGVSQVRILPSRAISMMYSVMAGKRLTCWTGMFRAVKREAIQSISINQNGFDGVAEIAVKLARRRCRIIEVPAVLSRRTEGVSKSSFKREFWKHLTQLYRVAIRRV